MNILAKIKQRYFYGISVKLFLIAKISICVLLLLSFMPNINVFSFWGVKINLISIISIFFVILLSFAYNKMLAKPLVKLNDAVESIAMLNFNTHLNLTSKDEFGELSNNLNILTHKLKTTINQLEQELNKNINLLNQQKELTDNLSHEIKTPLSVITAYSQAIKDNIEPALNKMYLDTIIRETTKINKLLVDLLSISSYQSGAVQLSPESFDLVLLVEEISGKILIDSSQKELEVVCNFSERDIYITADKNQIEKVITNLIMNAYLYVDNKRKIEINITKQKDTVLLQVYNTCDCFTDEQLSNIWNRFYRIDKSRDNHAGGSGLGLAMVKHILKLHDFKFGARNKHNGIEFWISI